MSGTTNLSGLKTKYQNFQVPDVEILSDGAKLIATKKCEIQELNVDLTNGYEASGCDFVVGDCYDVDKKDFKADITAKLQIGAKIEIRLGYGKSLTNVFVGYIDAVTYEFDKLEAAAIRVSCMDAKGLLMKNRRLEAFKETKADAVVKALLSEQPVSTYIAGKTVDRCSKEAVPLRSGMKSDYEIITEQAQKLGFEFFVVQGKVYFIKSEKFTTPIMSITPECPIEESSVTFSANKLVQTVEVRSIQQGNGKMLSGKARLSGARHKAAGKASKLYNGTTQVFYEAGVDSASEASARARVRMAAARAQYGMMEFSIVGLPELVPGRFVKLEKFASVVDGSYYITDIGHRFDEKGFYTLVKARRSL